MDAKELLEWMAYDLACDDEFRGKAVREQELERQKSFTAEQEAEAIRNMFRGLCGTDS